MAKAGVLTDAFGSRYYSESMVAAAVGVSVKELNGLIAAGYIPPPEIRFGSKRVWPEHVVGSLVRTAKAGAAWAPFR
jgi:hypothetical protein